MGAGSHAATVTLGSTGATTGRTARAAITTTIATASAVAISAISPLAVAYALQHFGAGRFCSSLHYVTAWWFAGTAPNRLATHGDRFGALAGLGHEAFNHLHSNFLLGETFDVLHEAFFIQTHQIDGCAFGTSTTGTTDAVHVIFANVRDFVVDHVRQVVNVDTAGGDVGGHQGTNVATFEAL